MSPSQIRTLPTTRRRRLPATTTTRRGRPPILDCATVLLLAAALSLSACGGDGGDGGGGADATGGAPAQTTTRGDAMQVETIATGLEAPWEIAFLPDGRALVTERPGRVRLLEDGGLRDEPLATVDVDDAGEGGLLGAAVDPAFEDNGFVYLYRTVRDGNEVARYRLAGSRLEEDAVVVDGIPAAAIHNGGRIHFGPDERLYISTGDAGRQSLAQDEDSLAGKFLRMAPSAYRGDGGRPQVHSLGHRNPQGFDWQPGSGRMLATEHGPSADDEVNHIERGANYGWPEVQGGDHGRFTAPLKVWTDMTVAPSGAAFVSREGSAWTGSFLVAGLRGESLRRLRLDGADVTSDEALIDGDHGRLRSVVEGPRGRIHVLTSNRDGRGSPDDEDDRILRITPPAS
ncbi:MAG: PQQ-dependent sugar dehydrogenase [Thermoleophilia bacterium]